MMPWNHPLDRFPPGGDDADEIRVPDSEIKSTVVQRLRENPYTMDHRIRVGVKHGAVFLSGEVPSAAAEEAAEEDVWKTPGVVEVTNQLTLAAAGIPAPTARAGARNAA
jgi:osmotically-inducible protein OsmY